MKCMGILFLCLCVAVSSCEGGPEKKQRRGWGRPGKTSGKQTGCKDKTTFLMSSADLLKKPFTFKCPKGPVAEADAIGVKGTCRGFSSHFLMTANRCHWNDTCKYTFEGKPLVKLTKDSKEPTSGSCIGAVPDQFEMSFTCVKKNAPVTDILGQFVNTDKSEGIVRSHKLYPWTYRNGQQLGNVTFIKPRRPRGLSTLWISVRSFGILDTDYLFLSWKDNPNSEPSMRLVTPDHTTFRIAGIQSAVLTFYADYKSHHSELKGETKGFVLCYQWLQPNKTPRKGTTCTRVLHPVNCQSGEGKKRQQTPTQPKTGRKKQL